MQLIESNFNAQAAPIASTKAMLEHIMKQLGLLATPLAVLQVATNGTFESGSTRKFHFLPSRFSATATTGRCDSMHVPFSASIFILCFPFRQQGLFTPVSVCVRSSPFRSNDLLQCSLANCPCPGLPFRFLLLSHPASPVPVTFPLRCPYLLFPRQPSPLLIGGFCKHEYQPPPVSTQHLGWRRWISMGGSDISIEDKAVSIAGQLLEN